MVTCPMKLKRGTKVFYQGISRETWGPFNVPLVRPWISFGLLFTKKNSDRGRPRLQYLNVTKNRGGSFGDPL